MEEAFVAYLLSQSGITDLVGLRITWGVLPQGSTMPAVVLNKIDGIPEYADEGEVGLASARIQVDCYADTYASAKGVERALMASLSGVTFEQSGVKFQGIYAEDQQDSFEEAAGAEERQRVRLDFIVWHS